MGLRPSYAVFRDGEICHIRQPTNHRATRRFASDELVAGGWQHYEEFADHEPHSGSGYGAWDDAWHGRVGRSLRRTKTSPEVQRPFLDDELEATPYMAGASYEKGIRLFETNDFEGKISQVLVPCLTLSHPARCQTQLLRCHTHFSSPCACLICVALAGSIEVFQRSLELGHPDAGAVYSRLGESLYRLALGKEKPELTAELLQAYEHFNLGAHDFYSFQCLFCSRFGAHQRDMPAQGVDSHALVKLHTAHYGPWTLLKQLHAMSQRLHWSQPTLSIGRCEAIASG